MTRQKISIITCLLSALCLVNIFYTPPALALEPHINIKGLFNSTRDVTIKCLECHKQQAEEILKSTHWSWKRQRTVNGQSLMFGKKDSLAGFAIDIASNSSRCLKCHISSNPDINVFEKSEQADIDCLVCHDTTGKYKRNSDKTKLEQGDFELIARNVGKSLPGNCTACHFADCGLSASSDVNSSTASHKYSSQADIHMGDRLGAFSCQTCHINGSGHSFSRTMVHGSGVASLEGGCSSCHTNTPHKLDRLNRHTGVIACRTCHIPEYAVNKPAIISWNWLLTGKTGPVFQTVPGGRNFFLDRNGFTASTMIQPLYMWDDGADLLYTRGQRIRPQELTSLQRPSKKNPQSKIAPFRVIYGTQLYDTKYRYLISPLLSVQGNKLFPDPDWDAVAREGMKAIILPYSGQFGVVPTATYRRINHGVVPAADALGCTDCHTEEKSRMDWETLGYEKDPWSGNQREVLKRDPLPGNSFNKKIEPPPPVKEMRYFADPAI